MSQVAYQGSSSTLFERIELHTERKKVVILGDGCVGKTSLIARFTTKQFLTSYVPTVFENANIQMMIDKKRLDLALWDTAGQDEYSRLRPLSYPDTSVFLICFSIDCPVSFRNVEAKWIPEVHHYSGSTPIMLVGLKSDLRNANSVTTAEVLQVTQALALVYSKKVISYVECSALNDSGVQGVIESAARLALASSINKRRRSDKCSVM